MTMFKDEAQIELYGGNGGDGCCSFHREKFVDNGGPDGGNGGRGGNVIFRLNTNLNTLVDYVSAKVFRAESGVNGGKDNCYGRMGEDLILEVPEGTLITDTDTDEIVADITTENPEFVAARGGKGGQGNACFVSSIRQAPNFAETGERGRTRKVKLELKLVADVGIIGFPSVGKSTLISVISKAKPKIAEYEFTTLVPNLGVVKMEENKSFVVCDIPGLIEGASEGKGLGHEFLRHVQRCRLLVHVIDPFRGEVAEHYEKINHELENFDAKLAERKQIIVINKCDSVPEEDLNEFKEELKKVSGGKEIFAISAVAHMGLDELIRKMWAEIEALPKEEFVSSLVDEDEDEEYVIIKPHEENSKRWTSERIEEGVYRVHGRRFEQMTMMTPLDNNDGLARIIDVMHKLGIVHELRRKGAKRGDTVLIAEKQVEFVDFGDGE